MANNVFNVARVNKVMRAIQDVRELPQELVFLNRTPSVPALDGEIMARFVGRVLIADLVADDARAVTYSSGKFNFETSAAPNLKLGVNMTQEMLNQIAMLQAAGRSIDDPDGVLSRWEQRTIDSILLGIRQRQEALIVAMWADGLSYDRLGIKMTNVTWGMPADLKVTPATPWTTAATATPVTDIQVLIEVGRVRYGVTFDRVTMSLAAFRAMIATTEFQEKAKLFIPPQVTFASLPVQNNEAMKNLATNVLGVKEIEIYDSRYWAQAPDGTLSSNRYLPINKVLLSSMSNDNDPMAMDWANGVVTESIVSSILKGKIFGDFGGPTEGPASYVTGEHNPPSLTYWGVARGFPRKHLLQSTAVLTVGTLTETISVGEPF
jgi:hypothetical protein